MAELKSCPFCGKMPIIENCKDFGYFVKCKCGIEQSTLYAQRCDAVKRWNKRKDELQTDYTPDCPFCIRYGTEDCLGSDCRHYKTYKDELQTDCDTCRYGQDKHRYAHICNECGVGINNYTPQTEIEGKC